MYDQEVQRWVILQPAFTKERGRIGTYHLCIAIEVTRYAFPSVAFPDFQKIGIWNDFYVATTSAFGKPRCSPL